MCHGSSHLQVTFFCPLQLITITAFTTFAVSTVVFMACSFWKAMLYVRLMRQRRDEATLDVGSIQQEQDVMWTLNFKTSSKIGQYTTAQIQKEFGVEEVRPGLVVYHKTRGIATVVTAFNDKDDRPGSNSYLEKHRPRLTETVQDIYLAYANTLSAVVEDIPCVRACVHACVRASVCACRRCVAEGMGH